MGLKKLFATKIVHEAQRIEDALSIIYSILDQYYAHPNNYGTILLAHV
jgi:hypothetical protein